MKRLIVGVSGATGMPLTLELLKQLRQQENIEIHLVYTKGAKMTFEQEMNTRISELETLVDVVHDNDNIGASIASGSFKTDGMIIVPCSMKTVAGIHSGYTDNLLLRAADVVLKERRKLILVARESPFNTIHLRNMYELSQMGAMILPPMLSYYHQPECVEDCTRHIVGKILDQFEIEPRKFQRWNGLKLKENC